MPIIYPKFQWILGYLGAITGTPTPVDANFFDIPSKGYDFPVITGASMHGSTHFDRVDNINYTYTILYGGRWVGPPVPYSFVDAGVGLTGAQPMHRVGGSGNMVKAYVLNTWQVISTVAIITPQGGHGGFDVRVGTLQTATFFTDDYLTITVPPGKKFWQVSIPHVLKPTNIALAPNSGALSAQLTNIAGTAPDDVTVDVVLRQTPDPARL